MKSRRGRGSLALVAAVGVLQACASNAQVAPSAKVETRPESSPSAPDAGRDAGNAASALPLATLDALASRAPRLASGMREVARADVSDDAAGPAREITREVIHSGDHDTCVRVALAARPPVKASLVDGRGTVLVESSGALDDGALGAQGPVCVRKGDAVTLRLTTQGPFTARYVAWVSP